MQGSLLLWLEVGTPSAERLHKASKASPRVVVFTHGDVAALQKGARAKAIHKAESIEVYPLDGAFLDALDAATDRNARWSLSRNDGTLYVTSGDVSVETPVVRHSLGE
jgi:uncharacterized protein YaeQ